MGFFNKHIITPGPGVSKNERPKTALFRFFDVFFGKFWQILQLNALYFAMCIPVVTIGAATAGFTYCMKNFVAGKPVFVIHDFFKAFKNNWKQGSVILLMNAAVAALFFVAFSFYVFENAVVTQPALRIVFAVILGALAILYCMMQFYTYLLMVSFELKLGALLKNSFLFIVIGIKENLIAAFFMLVFVFLGILALFPFSIILCFLFLFSLMGCVTIFCVWPVVKRVMIDPYQEEKNEENEQIFKDDV